MTDWSDASGEAARRHKLARDPHRPQYHFLPPANWMNDPNGLIHWQGQYHLFYQYNPNGPFWGTMHWGHAASADLVHWSALPIALAPTPGSPDEDGCFSGCTVDDAGTPTIIYTGVRGEQQLPCLATGTDGLLTWQKYPGNPVIAGPPPGLSTTGFRDHAVWREDEGRRTKDERQPITDDRPAAPDPSSFVFRPSSGLWYQLIGSGIAGVGGTALLYRSPDLVHWEYMHPIYTGDLTQTGLMWECPDFFALGEQHVLVVSVLDDDRTPYPLYFSGDYAGHRFVPAHMGRPDYGESFYAPQTLGDAQGRRIMWGWLREGRDAAAQLEAGWSGVMSLPRILSLHPDGTLLMSPAPELEMLRGRQFRLLGAPLAASSSLRLPVRGDTLEILLELDPGDATTAGIAVRCSPDRSEQTLIYYDLEKQELVVDSSASSTSEGARGRLHAGPLALAKGEPLRLHIFIDRSVLEVFGNDRVCIAGRVYPSREDSLGIELFARGGAARLVALDVWDMASIWEE